MIQTKVHRRYLKKPARKMRPLLRLISGKGAADSLDALKFNSLRGAKDVWLLLKSGIQTLKDAGAKEDEIVISRAFAGEGPRLKRRWLRAKGQATEFRKELCHLTLELTSQTDQPKKISSQKGKK